MKSPLTKEDTLRKGKSQFSSLYLVKKSLLKKKGRRCASCYKINIPVRLARVRQKKGLLAEDGYCFLCHRCIIERQGERKRDKKRLWRRKATKRKVTKGGFWNRIRKKVYKRDGRRCVWCNTDKLLGLCSLIPLSRGGKLTFDNFVTTCSHCRPSKGDKLPLNFIFEAIDINEFLHEQLDEHLRVSDPGKYVQVRFFLFSEISEFLHKLTSNKNLPSRVRTRAELLNVKLLS